MAQQVLDKRRCVNQFTAIMNTIAFKATDELEAFIRQQAATRKTSVSQYIRGVFEALKPKRACKVIPKRHPVSGLWYNAAPPPRVPTQAELDEALKDYL